MSTSFLYDSINFFVTGGIESVTDLIRYDWNLGVTPPDELVSYWKLDESTGNALDSFGTNELTENGTVPAATGVLDGARGPFTDSNSFSDPSTDFDNLLYLAEAWFKTSTVPGATASTIMGKANAADTQGWIVGINSAQHLTIGFISGTLSGTTDVVDGAWHYVVFVNRATSGSNEMRIYLDGEIVTPEASGNGQSWTASTNDFYIGKYQRANSFFDGLIDEAAYWDLTGAPLSFAQIEPTIVNRYNSGLGRKYTV